jgi:hypothetical protein
MHKLLPMFLLVLGLLFIGLGFITLTKVWILGLFFVLEGLYFRYKTKKSNLKKIDGKGK